MRRRSRSPYRAFAGALGLRGSVSGDSCVAQPGPAPRLVVQDGPLAGVLALLFHSLPAESRRAIAAGVDVVATLGTGRDLFRFAPRGSGVVDVHLLNEPATDLPETITFPIRCYLEAAA